MKVIQILKRLLAVSLCAIVFFSTPVSSYAAEDNEGIMPAYTRIMYHYIYLSVGDGNAHIVADLEGRFDVTETYAKCNLEKLMGTYWMQIKSFSKTGTQYVNFEEYYPIDRGTYRVMGTYRCDTETITVYSTNETY